MKGSVVDGSRGGTAAALTVFQQFTREVEIRSPHRHEEKDAGVEVAWVEGRVHVVNLRKGSRADRAGLYVGDEILEINGVLLDAGYSTEAISALLSIGGTIRLTAKDGPRTPVTIRRTDPRQRLGIGCSDGKVSVEPGSPAAEHNLPKGHAIVEVEGKSMIGRSDKDIMRHINKARSTSVQLTLMDGTVHSEISRAMSPKLSRRNESPVALVSRSLESLRLGGNT